MYGLLNKKQQHYKFISQLAQKFMNPNPYKKLDIYEYIYIKRE